MTLDEAMKTLADALGLLHQVEKYLGALPESTEDAAPLTDDEWEQYAAVLEIAPEPVAPLALVPELEPTSSAEHDLSVAASLGARLAKAGKPRHEVLELMSGYPDAEVAAAVDAWVAAMPERRRYENVVYQVDHVRPEDGQVFTVKVHQNGFVTGLRADFPADVWRSAELVEA